MISILNNKCTEKSVGKTARSKNKPSDNTILFDIMVASTSSGQKNVLVANNSNNNKKQQQLQQLEVLKPKTFIANLKKKKKMPSTLKKRILMVDYN